MIITQLSRKFIATISVAAGTLAIAAAPAGAVTSATSWPSVDGNAARSRAVVGETLLTSHSLNYLHYAASAHALPPATPIDPDRGSAASDFVAPVVTGGYAYAMTAGKLLKANATTGRPVWHVKVDPYMTEFTALAVDNGLVIAGGINLLSESDTYGEIWAYSASTGKLVWQAFGVPVFYMRVSGSTIVIQDNPDEEGMGVMAFDVATGNALWSHTLGNCGVDPTPVIVAGEVIYGGCPPNPDGNPVNAYFEADSLATGHKVWRHPGYWQAQAGDTDATTGTDVYAIDPSGVLRDLNPVTGATRGNVAGAGAVLAVSPTYVFTTCSPSNVCAYARSNRKLVWTKPITGSAAPAVSAADVLYLGNGLTLNANTGASLRHLWAHQATALLEANSHLYSVVNPLSLDIYGLVSS